MPAPPRSRSGVDPRLLGLGLLTGAAVGVWAGRRARDWNNAVPTHETGLVDWDRAKSIALRMNQQDTLAPRVRERLDREYTELVQRTIPLVAAASGVELPRPMDKVYAFDRVDWINANITAFQHMFAPFEEMELLKPGNSRFFAGLNRTVVSAELGVLLGYLARRVLGQYDLALLGREPLESTGKLYFVEPNIEMTERALGIPRDQFRLWLALHETTHAFEFEAYPWVRGHMNGMIEQYFTHVTRDLDTLKEGIRGLRAYWDRARSGEQGEENRGWLAMLMTPEQRALFDQMQATMAVIEGYSNYIMNAVGRQLMPQFDLIHQRFEQRQQTKSSAEQMFIKLTGLDMKFEQYRLGESFINEIVRQRGDAIAHQLWDSADMLPSMEELRDPDSWLRRIDAQ